MTQYAIPTTPDEIRDMAARRCMDWLRKHGYPDPLVADSGNGYHLDLPTDLPNDGASKGLVKRFLKAIAGVFETDEVEVDATVTNAARLDKVYGTMTRK